MGFMGKLFGMSRPAEADVHSQSHLASGQSRASNLGTAVATPRKDLVAAALRHTLSHNGIPVDWIVAETLASRSRNGSMGVHVRLVVAHWDPRLMLRLVPIESAFIVRLHRLDPVAEQWMMGITWRFAFADESVCPPMPHPGSWTSQPNEGAGQLHPSAAPQSEAGVIEGPVVVESGDKRRELDRLMAQGDAAFQQESTGYEATQAMDIRTEPMPLRREN
jgi:hypothetical protein